MPLPSSRRRIDPRRRIYLSLAGQIEGQLRDAYARKHAAGLETQSSLAQKLGVNRSAVHHRLMGRTNMTIETIADMVWALGYAIRVRIYDPTIERRNDEFFDADPRDDSRPGSHNEENRADVEFA